MPIELRKAERKRAKLRIGTSGPSGSGKTYSALQIARGIAPWEKIAVIDTENGSAELYSNLGGYYVIPLEAPYSPERYVEAIKAAEDGGMSVIIIDSVTHEWDGKGGCLELNELLAKSKFKGNTWAAWSETTPRHQRFIHAITNSRCHIITTARAKTDMMQTADNKIKKVGMKEIQREGFEYELTVNFTLDRDGHLALASKDRTGLFIDRDPFVISEETGKELAAWNDGGAVDVKQLKRELLNQYARLSIEMPPEEFEWFGYIQATLPKLVGMQYAEDKLDEIVKKLSEITDSSAAQSLLAVKQENTIVTPEAVEQPVTVPEKTEQVVPAPAQETQPEAVSATTEATTPVTQPESNPV